jgi:mono/diheme cytochrome c family protein
VASRIGELLFFTTLMSPWNSSDGKLSRFTCETCHHEGYVDGRVHYTGRGRVFAATRPLHGLGNLRPYFSRALDGTMTDMVHAEFRVANRHNGRDPWFALRRADAPWLAHVAGAPAELSPALLREAFMAFLVDFTHRANPAAVDHARFTPRERAGAELFRARCAGCHAARLVADDPGSEVGFERWEPLVLSASGPIVWSNAAYAKTGVEPYVYDRGARVAPLRRLYKKWPYFTNGSARSLGELLDRFAWGAGGAYHDRAPADAPGPASAAPGRLTAEDRAALLAFLDLL